METLTQIAEIAGITIVMDSILTWKYGHNSYLLDKQQLILSRWPHPEEERSIIEKIQLNLPGLHTMVPYQEPYIVVDNAWKGLWNC